MSVGVRCSIAVVIAGVFTLLNLALRRWLGPESAYLLLAGASMLAAWIGGFGPGLLATGLVAFGANAPELRASSDFTLTHGALAQCAGFLLEGGVISWGTAALHLARQRAEARAHALQQSAETITAMFESAAEGIVTVGQDGAILRVNHKLEEMFRYRRGDLEGQPLELLLPERLRSTHEGHRLGYFADPRTRPMGRGMTLMGRRNDGVEFPIEVSLSHVASAQGAFAMAFVSDISERVTLERAARVNEKLAALATFSAGIAHELNNPIGIMSSRLELMLMDVVGLAIPESLSDDLRVLQRNLTRVGQIATTMLNFARHGPQDARPVNLNTVVENTLLLVGKQLTKEGVQISTTLAPDLPFISGDSNALEQVLMNLLLNARDALTQGGSVKIETSPTPEPPGGVQLIVADTGPGMAPDVLVKIAEPFYTTKTHGTGLGLSVSYRIVREHRGTIDVESELGRGTTFIVRLPP
jgi:PAS domain S-box-containing protein